eukprot:c45453_g1_i1.p1 GENE.c45453_g1_i1~~c45453_g1_i1.p1  ORF type:complete len:289 (-),score=37.19 c45453_g1_i1:49-915(-)
MGPSIDIWNMVSWVWCLGLVVVAGLPEDVFYPQARLSQYSMNMESAPPMLKEVWFINLLDQPQRRKMQVSQLQEVGVPFHRKNATKVSRISDCDYDPAAASLAQGVAKMKSKYGLDPTDPTRPLSRTAAFVLSVFLSHMTLYEQIYEDNSEDDSAAVLVLEDDCKLCENFNFRLAMALRALPEDWELVRLGFFGLSRPEDQIREGVFATKQPYWQENATDVFYGGSHAVLLRVKFLPHILEVLKAKPLTDMDNLLTAFPDIRAYAFGKDFSLVSVDWDIAEQSHPKSL